MLGSWRILGHRFLLSAILRDGLYKRRLPVSPGDILDTTNPYAASGNKVKLVGQAEFVIILAAAEVYRGNAPTCCLFGQEVPHDCAWRKMRPSQGHMTKKPQIAL